MIALSSDDWLTLQLACEQLKTESPRVARHLHWLSQVACHNAMQAMASEKGAEAEKLLLDLRPPQS